MVLLAKSLEFRAQLFSRASQFEVSSREKLFIVGGDNEKSAESMHQLLAPVGMLIVLMTDVLILSFHSTKAAIVLRFVAIIALVTGSSLAAVLFVPAMAALLLNPCRQRQEELPDPASANTGAA